MKNRIARIVVAGLLLSTGSLFAQNVGINETGVAPSGDALLDVNSTSGTKGLLIPRVNIANLATIAPITGGSTTSLLVYNTNVTTGVGYYYWDGSQWVKFNTGGDDWKITGNANTTSGTNFLGTTNAQALDFRTNNTIRFRVANGNQVHAMSLGTTGAPFYSFDADQNTGMWSSTADRLNFSTAGAERLELGTTEAVFNDVSNDVNFRVESNGNANMIFVDAGNDEVGIGKVPTEALDVNGNVRFSGALMPNNLPGTANQTLLSNGAGVAPGWSAFTFLNTPAIANIGKYYSTLSWTGTWSNNTSLTFTITDANLVCGTHVSAVYISFDCTNSNAIMAGFNIHNVKVNAGNMAITVRNETGFNFSSGGIPFVYVAFY
ncbi:MAG: hypothetical protein KDD41_07150 [Flavobacteriales bacterium]|nr:hypothetical protein [Flavobacteriales bacterium]